MKPNNVDDLCRSKSDHAVLIKGKTSALFHRGLLDGSSAPFLARHAGFIHLMATTPETRIEILREDTLGQSVFAINEQG